MAGSNRAKAPGRLAIVGGSLLSLLAFFAAIATAPRTSAAPDQSAAVSPTATPTPRVAPRPNDRVRPFSAPPNAGPTQAAPPRLRSRGS